VLPPVRRISWVDNDETLAFTQSDAPAQAPSHGGCQPLAARSLLAFHATRWPYGVNLVVRIARIECD
jgi:hypothetical protein